MKTKRTRVDYWLTFHGVFQESNDHILSFDHELGHRSNGVNVQRIILTVVQMLDENREDLIDQRWFDSIESSADEEVVLLSSVRCRLTERFPPDIHKLSRRIEWISSWSFPVKTTASIDDHCYLRCWADRTRIHFSIVEKLRVSCPNGDKEEEENLELIVFDWSKLMGYAG